MKTAMILAAGRGERLRPLTWERPKCLSLIKGRPLLAYHLDRLIDAGFTKIVINHAYLGSQIRQFVTGLALKPIDILFSPEPAGGLETGGGIQQALPYLGDSSFAVINADIVTDFDYRKLPDISPGQAHIVLIEKPHSIQRGDFGLEDNDVTNDNRLYTFSGIACYHTQLIQTLPVGRYSITPLLRKLADARHLTGQLHGGKWLDIGSLNRLAQAQSMNL